MEEGQREVSTFPQEALGRPHLLVGRAAMGSNPSGPGELRAGCPCRLDAEDAAAELVTVETWEPNPQSPGGHSEHQKLSVQVSVKCNK